MVDIKDCLVIGISSRALFDLDEENQIFEKEGLKAYSDYQIEHEDDILKPGSAFPLVQSLLKLNEGKDKRVVEVLVMSRNSADTSLRIFKSIEHYHLDITRAVLSGGASLNKYLSVFKVDLFLSASENDVKQALKDGFAAGLIYRSMSYPLQANDDVIRIAFDGDAVIFGDEAEMVFQKEGLNAFVEHEKRFKEQALPQGPFAKFLMTIAQLQNNYDEQHQRIRTALVTARNAPTHERVIRTLRAWNVRIDEAFFLGGLSKKEILEAFNPHIFFDDQKVHIDSTSEKVPSAQVPWINEGDKYNGK